MNFDLDDPDDAKAHLRATLSLKMAIALWEIYHLPSHLENVPEELLLEVFTERINDIFQSNGIDVNKIID